MSNGDIGYPDEYEEQFASWEYISKEEESCPDWITAPLVEKYCEI
jgi:hypothetical protein